MIINGGANLIIFPCVGFASNPLEAIFKHILHAIFESLLSLIIIAFKSPFPRTDLTILLSLMYLFNFSLKMIPKIFALSDNSSSFTTFKAAIATWHANGFPPKVDPCSPWSSI